MHPVQISVRVLISSGHFIWVNLGGKLGFSDIPSEKQVFQKLLDGGVYIVSNTYPVTLRLNTFSSVWRLT